MSWPYLHSWVRSATGGVDEPISEVGVQNALDLARANDISLQDGLHIYRRYRVAQRARPAWEAAHTARR
jgi:hypothetical protein